MKNRFYVEKYNNGKPTPDRQDGYPLYSLCLYRIEHFEIDDLNCGEFVAGNYCVTNQDGKVINRVW